MESIDKIIDKVMRLLMAVSMFGLVLAGTWQIVTRFIMGKPSTVTDEMLRFLLIWASMIGSAYCFYKDEHLALDLIKGRLKGTPSKIVNTFVELSVILFVGFVFIYGGGRLAMNSNNASAVMQIPYKLLFSIMPISGVIIILARILKYAQIAKNNRIGGNK